MPTKNNRREEDEREEVPAQESRAKQDAAEETGEQYEEILQDWLEYGREIDAEPRADVYKYLNPDHGAAKEGIGYFIGDQIPTRHQIGLMEGSGKYSIDLQFYKKEAIQKKGRKRITFRLGKRYDELKREEDAKKNPPRDPAAPPAPGQSAADTLQLVRDFLAIILPQVTAAKQQPAALPAPQNTAQDMLNQYAIMQKILKANLFDTAATYQEFNRRFSAGALNAPGIDDDEDEDDQEPPQKEKSLMEKIIEMIEPFFGLLAQKSSAAQVAAQTLRAAPQFTAILEDKNLCRMIIQHFDRTKGREAADRALKNIGINREAFFNAIGQRQAAPRIPAAPQAATGKPTAPAAPQAARKAPKGGAK